MMLSQCESLQPSPSAFFCRETADAAGRMLALRLWKQVHRPKRDAELPDRTLTEQQGLGGVLMQDRGAGGVVGQHFRCKGSGKQARWHHKVSSQYCNADTVTAARMNKSCNATHRRSQKCFSLGCRMQPGNPGGLLRITRISKGPEHRNLRV